MKIDRIEITPIYEGHVFKDWKHKVYFDYGDGSKIGCDYTLDEIDRHLEKRVERLAKLYEDTPSFKFGAA